LYKHNFSFLWDKCPRVQITRSYGKYLFIFIRKWPNYLTWWLYLSHQQLGNPGSLRSHQHFICHYFLAVLRCV
jgi:hypothetical protein